MLFLRVNVYYKLQGKADGDGLVAVTHLVRERVSILHLREPLWHLDSDADLTAIHRADRS